MVLLEQLRVHVGGLILLKSELWWYGGRGWDGCPGRICLLMDATDASSRPGAATPDALARPHPARERHRGEAVRAGAAGLLLIIDGCPHWVWVRSDDLELLQPGCNPSGGVV